MRGLNRTGREGFALVAALWLLVALGSVGLQAALASRARRQAAANLLDEVRARAAVGKGAPSSFSPFFFFSSLPWSSPFSSSDSSSSSLFSSSKSSTSDSERWNRSHAFWVRKLA